MKLTIIFLAIFIGGIIYAGFNPPQKNDEGKVPFPKFESVVINDSRSFCEKHQEIATAEKWNELCGEVDGKYCSLRKDEAEKAISYGMEVRMKCKE